MSEIFGSQSVEVGIFAGEELIERTLSVGWSIPLLMPREQGLNWNSLRETVEPWLKGSAWEKNLSDLQSYSKTRLSLARSPLVEIQQLLFFWS